MDSRIKAGQGAAIRILTKTGMKTQKIVIFNLFSDESEVKEWTRGS